MQPTSDGQDNVGPFQLFSNPTMACYRECFSTRAPYPGPESHDTTDILAEYQKKSMKKKPFENPTIPLELILQSSNYKPN